ncbi:MAG: hypothetical protein WCA07_08780 [Gloeobacterales cyanobacterium]
MTFTFESAIEEAQNLLDSRTLSETEMLDRTKTLLETEAGARGFFVVFLTGDSILADCPPGWLLSLFAKAPELVAELLIKNLAMSTATTLAHEAQGNPEQADGSRQVAQRTTAILKALCHPPFGPVPVLERKMRSMLQTLRDEEGPYRNFLDRWEYDSKQRQAIGHAFEKVQG